MAVDPARLKRLRRLEAVRAIARHDAARAAAEAEGTLAQLETLVARTRRMADDYRGLRAETDGFGLRQVSQFVSGLGRIADNTGRDSDQARALADARQRELALAERRRAAVSERAAAEQRLLDRQRQTTIAGARRSLGTGLE